eukprot:CAMPEP_0181221276 /NCGR_PEP_ID=MMETSP1096-20121128/29305_1 /TAXON_ID=156174 ORGANISM="Chrysochromulina ericina, Strain CCMP281" /NCGR_SAMPLE_ID=MMETSP1096 /ASSEMBLY_ACC=CAM_ASM_000453 /LENGTH=114 /DNA_ID=CAMNT_0023313877 /DNA_START=149 /DNA_END=492 /DNA_ORIENTATION=+
MAARVSPCLGLSSPRVTALHTASCSAGAPHARRVCCAMADVQRRKLPRVDHAFDSGVEIAQVEAAVCAEEPSLSVPRAWQDPILPLRTASVSYVRLHCVPMARHVAAALVTASS